MRSDLMKAVVAGITGTLIMSMVGLYAAPMMGLPKMNPADMLAMQMGGSALLGWLAHLMIGMILAIVYLLLAAGRLPGPAPVQGAIFALAPWLLAMLVMMPMMGMPAFGGGTKPAVGSLIGHLLYGLVIGAMIGVPPREPSYSTA